MHVTLPKNLASMFAETAAAKPDAVAIRYCAPHGYVPVTWREYEHDVRQLAAQLIGQGIAAGDRVGILSENRWEWLLADLAILSAGAVNVPLHAPLTAPQSAYQLSHAEASCVFVSSQTQADKVLASLPELPCLKFLISFDPVDTGGRLPCRTLSNLLTEPAAASFLDQVHQRTNATTSDDLATIIYTSGTTGRPKGVMLTHGNLCSNAAGVMQISDHREDDVLMSWLPYSHIYARTVDHYSTILGRSELCLAQSMDTLLDNMKQVHPTWITAVPRFYEKVWAAVEALPTGSRAAALHNIFGPRIRWLSSGGAPLPRHVWHGIWDAGIPILEGYGLTETSPVITFSRLAAYKEGSVGTCIPGVDVCIADDGEILTRGPHVMRGYWKDTAATADTICNGWLHTGDVGRLDSEGFLYITDRKKDLIVTALGKNIAPTEIERLLVADAYIDQAVVHGDRRPFLSALIVPNLAMLEKLAQERGWSLQAVDGALVDPNLLAFFAERVDTCMQCMSPPERVRKFVLLARAFQLADDELTATLKVRRRFLQERYAELLNGLYTAASGSETV